MSSYEAICFDLDWTLCQPTRDPDEVLAAVFEHADVAPFCRAEDIQRTVHEVTAPVTDREFFEDLFTHIAATKGIDQGCAPTLAESFLEVRDPTAVRLCEGAERALERARDIGPVGLVTNGSKPYQRQKLEALGLRDAFDVTVFTDPTSGMYPKPDPSPFEHVLSSVGVTPERSIHVGDSLRSDVAGASAAGMDSAWLAQSEPSAGVDLEPTYRLSSLEDIHGIV